MEERKYYINIRKEIVKKKPKKNTSDDIRFTDLVGQDVIDMIELSDSEDPLLQEDPNPGALYNFPNDKLFTKFQSFQDKNPVFKLGKSLGKGGFGTVRSAYHIKTGEMVALKYLQK